MDHNTVFAIVKPLGTLVFIYLIVKPLAWLVERGCRTARQKIRAAIDRKRGGTLLPRDGTSE